MKTYKRTILLLVLICSSLIFITSCSDDDKNDPVGPKSGYDFTAILKNVTENTIVKTYSNLATEAGKLNSAVQNFHSTGKQADLQKCSEAWISARTHWESSEGFLFGPVAFRNYDPSLDSWPLDKAQLDEVLASSLELTPDFILEGLGFALRGFHTIEYLIFRDGQTRNVSDITDREKEYLVAVTQVLADQTQELYDDWKNGFASEVINAGKPGSRYSSQEDAIEELFGGLETIADEVGNGKIKDPYESKDVLDVESWFSWNSLTDFQDNIKSIKNVYTSSGSGASISDFVKSKNSDLDAKLKNEIDNAITAIAAIPAPFRNNLSASEAPVAMEACKALLETIGEAKSLVKQ